MPTKTPPPTPATPASYRASLDGLAKGLTLAMLLLFAALSWPALRHLLAPEGTPPALELPGVLPLGLVLLVLGSYGFSVQRYSLTADALIIHRLLRNRRLPLADIVEIRALARADLDGSLRTFGNGGLFGYYGRYRHPRLGAMTWYTTQRRNRVLLRTRQGEKLVLSPDDVGLVAAVRRQAALAKGQAM